MKKTYLLTLTLTLSLTSALAQLQKPQWEMPFYLEDAEGNNDTVWVGYDTLASPYAEYDTLFESWIQIVDSSFQTILFKGEPAPAGKGRKREVTSYMFPRIEIHFNKGKLPLTIRWPDDSLNSPHLPFPEVPLHPRAKMYALNNLGNAFTQVPCPLHGYYVFTGDPSYMPSSVWQCVAIGDSLWLSSPDNELYTAETSFGMIRFDVVPFDDTLTLGISSHNAGQISVYPNPFQSHFTIDNSSAEFMQIQLYDGMFRQLFSQSVKPRSNVTIELHEQPAGIYFVKMGSKSHSSVKKVMKLQ